MVEDARFNIETAIDERHVSFAYLYLAAMDALLHAEGTRAPAVAAKIRGYEQRIRHLIEQARSRYDGVRILAFSDRGMTGVRHTCHPAARPRPPRPVPGASITCSPTTPPASPT